MPKQRSENPNNDRRIEDETSRGYVNKEIAFKQITLLLTRQSLTSGKRCGLFDIRLSSCLDKRRVKRGLDLFGPPVAPP